MGPFAWLFLLSSAMLTGSFLVGSIPLAFHLSDARLRILSTFGSGLLVGTALIVIIPEGVETLQSVSDQLALRSSRGSFPGGDPLRATGGDGGTGSGSRPRYGKAAAAAGHNHHNDGGVVDGDLDDSGPGVRHAHPRRWAAARNLLPQEDEYEERRLPPPAPGAAGAAGDPANNPVADLMPDDDPAADHQPSPVSPDAGSGGSGGFDEDQASRDGTSHSDHKHEHDHDDEDSTHGYIGPSMTFGFLFMLLLDQFGNYLASSRSLGGGGMGIVGGSGPDGHVSHIAISEFRSEAPVDLVTGGGDPGETRPGSASGGSSTGSVKGSGSGGGGGPHDDDDERSQFSSPSAAYGGGHHHHNNNARRKSGLGKMAATLGLVVHAAADGIALGAAVATDQSTLGMIVFLAIMLHKAPTAFGLVTHLLREGASRKTIRQHLLAFSLAAPLGAFATFLVLTQVGWDDALGMRTWTGILLLFSAGSFLYVATVHILPEIYAKPGGAGGGSGHHHHAHGGQHGSDHLLTTPQVVALVAGMFAPYFLMIKHTH
ncbi:ZIP zinc transporter-domain-containing protein [Zopfochytrium polystomum]|nr:ZIP zinc transporter-domain-containing protein [Zopfochytrium polystomum]